MAITAAQVKELREMTGAGMMDCKKALTETDGDMDKAVDYLRENGLAKAEKKAGRIAAEGIVKTNISADKKRASIVEVNSETDFVAKNADFQTACVDDRRDDGDDDQKHGHVGKIAGCQQYDGQRWQYGVFGGNAIRRTLFVVDQAQQKTQRPYADARGVFHKSLHDFLCMECDRGREKQRVNNGQNGESDRLSDAVF